MRSLGLDQLKSLYKINKDLISKDSLNEVIEGEYVLSLKGKGEEKTTSLEDKRNEKVKRKKED